MAERCHKWHRDHGIAENWHYWQACHLMAGNWHYWQTCHLIAGKWHYWQACHLIAENWHYWQVGHWMAGGCWATQGAGRDGRRPATRHGDLGQMTATKRHQWQGDRRGPVARGISLNAQKGGAAVSGRKGGKGRRKAEH